MRGALGLVGELLAAALAVVGVLALWAGDWTPAALAVGLLALRWRWAPRPPAHVREALASRGGTALRTELRGAVARALVQGHRWGVPPEALAQVLEDAGQELREGRAAALFPAGREGGDT